MNRKFWQAGASVILTLLLLTGCFEKKQEPTEPSVTEPEKRTGVRYLPDLPDRWNAPEADSEGAKFLRKLTTVPLYEMGNTGMEAGLASLPEDVTGEMTGTYGIPLGAQRGYAFRIRIREGLYWQNGDPVTGDDLAYTLEQLLQEEPSDWQWIAGARCLQEGWEQKSDDVISLREAGFQNMTQAEEQGYHQFYLDTDTFWGLDGGWKHIADREKLRDYAMPSGLLEYYVSPAYLFGNYLAPGREYQYLQEEFIGVVRDPSQKMTAEDVGILRAEDHALIIVSESPLAAGTLAARLCDVCLQRPGIENWGASPEQYLSYGPYAIETAGTGEIILERNPVWIGERYPADAIICRAS